MKYHKQVFMHNPKDGIIGDCWRTALACLLDKESPEDVPHFLQDCPDVDTFYERSAAWLVEEGYAMFTCVYEPSTKERTPELIIEGVSSQNPGLLWLLAGLSAANDNHVVICCDNEIVHDPSIRNSGIVAPCMPDDRYYYVYVLVPLLHRIQT